MDNMIPKRHARYEEYMRVLAGYKEELEDSARLCGFLTYYEFLDLLDLPDHMALKTYFETQKLMNKTRVFDELCELSHEGNTNATIALLNYYKETIAEDEFRNPNKP